MVEEGSQPIPWRSVSRYAFSANAVAAVERILPGGYWSEGCIGSGVGGGRIGAVDRDEGEGVEKGVADCRLRAWMRVGVLAPATADFLRGLAIMRWITTKKKKKDG